MIRPGTRKARPKLAHREVRYEVAPAQLSDTNQWEYLADLKIAIAKTLGKVMSIRDTRFLRSSDMNVSGQKTDPLISVLERIGADEYVSGPAAKSYIKIEKFRQAKRQVG